MAATRAIHAVVHGEKNTSQEHVRIDQVTMDDVKEIVYLQQQQQAKIENQHCANAIDTQRHILYIFISVQQKIKLPASFQVEANHFAQEIKTTLGNFTRWSSRTESIVSVTRQCSVARFFFQQHVDNVLQQAPVDNEDLIGNTEITAATQPALDGAAQPESTLITIVCNKIKLANVLFFVFSSFSKRDLVT